MRLNWNRVPQLLILLAASVWISTCFHTASVELYAGGGLIPHLNFGFYLYVVLKILIRVIADSIPAILIGGALFWWFGKGKE